MKHPVNFLVRNAWIAVVRAVREIGKLVDWLKKR